MNLLLKSLTFLLLGISTTYIYANPTPDTTTKPLHWITLGTNGGPFPKAERSEPANLLLVDGKPWLVDCGDGAMERLAAAKFQATDISVLFLSHLHMDHIGGLQGLIGLRWMTSFNVNYNIKPLTIYGPPGTKELVDGILQSLTPSVKIGQLEPMHSNKPVSEIVKVVIIKDGDDLTVDGVRVRAVRNSHFDSPLGHHLDNGSQALSYRFDKDSYAITYTGDTGPSQAVTDLAKDSNILISEVIDMEAMNNMFLKNKSMSDQTKDNMLNHFETQHLTEAMAGKMAASAKVKLLVYTHIAAENPDPGLVDRIMSLTKQVYDGQIVVAHDLEQF